MMIKNIFGGAEPLSLLDLFLSKAFGQFESRLNFGRLRRAYTFELTLLRDTRSFQLTERFSKFLNDFPSRVKRSLASL